MSRRSITKVVSSVLVSCVVSAAAWLSAAPAHADRGVQSIPNTPYGTSFGTFGNP